MKDLLAYEQHLRATGKTKATQRTYIYHARRLLTTTDAATYLANLNGSPAYLRSAAACCRAYLRWIGADLPPLPPRRLREQRTLSPEEVSALIAVADTLDRAWIMLAYDALLRVSELAAAKRSDLQPNSIRVHGKGARIDYVAISEPTAAALDAYLRQRRDHDPALFVARRPMRPATFRARLRALCKKAGIPHATPHALRRGGAVAMLRQGASTRLVQLHGRWTSLAMVELYTRALEARHLFPQFAPANGIKSTF